MSKDIISEFGDFRNGLYVSLDSTKAPLGSARLMKNARITDIGGISKRPGIELLGDFNTSDEPCVGFGVFVKSDVASEIPIKAYDGKLEYYSPSTLSWEFLNDGYTDGKDFGFILGLTMAGNVDKYYIGNAYEEDSYWFGVTTALTADLALLDTVIEVTSVLRDDIYVSDTSIASAATTIQATTGEEMVDDQWNNFYVYIKTGTHAGKIRKITGTVGTTRTITFDTLGTTPGLCDYEIRFTDFSATGTLVVNGSEVAYTAIPEYNKFTIAASTITGSIGDGVTSAVVTIPGNPRGNRQVALKGRRFLGNVRSGLSRDSAGTYGGSASLGSIFVSKVVDWTNLTNNYDSFEYSDPRVAGEGYIITISKGGVGTVDLKVFNDKVYIFKDSSINSIYNTADLLDTPIIKNISNAYGAITRPIQAKDDVYFMTSDKQLTSLGIVESKGADKELATNIGLNVKRFLQDKSYDRNARGEFFQNRLYLPYKEEESDSNTNGLLIYSQDGRFEGNWSLNVNSMRIYDGDLYATSSTSANCYKLETGLNDIIGEDGDNDKAYPVSFEWISNWHNLTSSNFNLQEVSMFACEGYIKLNTQLDFSLYKDFSDIPFKEFSFLGTDPQVDNDLSGAFLGAFPLGSEPLGAISSEETEDGMHHFMFMIYFEPQQAEDVSWGFTNSGLDENFQIIRAGMSLSESTCADFGNRILNI